MTKPRGLVFAAVLWTAGCIGSSRAQTAAEGGARVPGKEWNLSHVGNLSRVPGLKAPHKDLLAKQGFFLTPQDPPPRPKTKPSSAGEYANPRAQTQATHLFHVYERNDYLRFPSFITVDLAIDTTHAFFDAVLRDLEEYQLGPMLGRALASLLKEAEKVRAGANTDTGRREAGRSATFWAVALRLLNDKATIPPALRADTQNLVKAINAAESPLPIAISKADFDVTQTRPRGHYTRSKGLERFFRSMSWLGMAAFPVEGKQTDVETVALLARAWLGSKVGREGLERLMTVTSFFAGGADASGLAEAAEALKRVLPDADKVTADKLVASDVQARLGKELAAALAPPRIDQGQADRQVRVLGRRAFEDTVGMQMLIPALVGAASVNVGFAVSALMGPRGAAAVLGSPIAREVILADLPGAVHSRFNADLGKGRDMVAAVAQDRWSQDAYRGTLYALRTLLDPLPDKMPQLLTTDAWRLRALQAFASGWAELRHDTILYGAQMGAECDAEDLEPPPCWVEPVPDLYRRLAAMARGLDKRLAGSGIDLNFTPKAKPRAPDGTPDATEMVLPLAEKTKMLLKFLDELAETAQVEVKGGNLARAQLDRLTIIGGTVEWMLMSFANSGEMNDRDADMAVVADVFTWRPSGEALEVGVARPDLIYAIIPSAHGPVLARGAVMSYREFMQPIEKRMTDEEWRKEIEAGRTPARPSWLAPLYAEPAGPVKPPKVTQGRCGPMSGAFIECL
jgi:hypothetical protein